LKETIERITFTIEENNGMVRELKENIRLLNLESEKMKRDLDGLDYEKKLKSNECERLSKSNSDLRKELTDIQTLNRQKELENQNLKSEINTFVTTVKQKENHIEQLQKQLSDFKDEFNRCNLELKQKENELQELLGTHDDLREKFLAKEHEVMIMKNE